MYFFAVYTVDVPVLLVVVGGTRSDEVKPIIMGYLSKKRYFVLSPSSWPSVLLSFPDGYGKGDLRIINIFETQLCGISKNISFQTQW